MGRNRIILIIVLLVVLATIALSVWGVNRRSLESRIVALDARRYVPDVNNAALSYARSILLASEPEEALALCEKLPALQTRYKELASSKEMTLLVNDAAIDRSSIAFTESRPWRRIDAPEMADWLDQRQTLFQDLIDASKKTDCFFPLLRGRDRISLLDIPSGRPFRRLSFVLRRAAYYDLGEGKTRQAIDKCETAIRMGRHLQQQPVEILIMIGVACESLGMDMMEDIILNGAVQHGDLDGYQALYSAPQITAWPSRKEIGLGQAWIERQVESDISWRFRFKMMWQDLFFQSPYTPATVVYARFASIRHAQPILVALRRYYDRTGQWPASLKDIASELPSEAFIDPQCDMPYVYQPTESGFCLYSRGPNGRDEGGKRSKGKTGSDDLVIWRSRNN